MKPMIVAIWGKANSGKTTTIIEISNRVKNKYNPSAEQINKPGKEIVEILKWNNFTVGICSLGDPGGHLERNKKSERDRC